MLPETCDPTCTVITALMVPVASTTSLIAPRSTFAVKCCAGVFRFRAHATNSPVTTTTHTKMSHRPLIFMSSFLRNKTRDASLVAQRFNRIQPRCFSRRVVSEKGANGDRKDRRYDDRLQRHLDRPMQRLSDQVGTEDTKDHSRGAPDQAEHDGLSEKLKLDGPFGRSYCHPHSNFPRALSYRHQHHIHDSDASHDQRNRCDGNQENGERLTGIELRLNDVLGIP